MPTPASSPKEGALASLEKPNLRHVVADCGFRGVPLYWLSAVGVRPIIPKFFVFGKWTSGGIHLPFSDLWGYTYISIWFVCLFVWFA